MGSGDRNVSMAGGVDRRVRMILLIALSGLIASGTCIARFANSTSRVDCFRKQYRLVRRVTDACSNWGTRDVGIASFHVNIS